MIRDNRNPFDPDRQDVPLLVTLDSRSIPKLTGTGRAEADLLLELCSTECLDALVVWGQPGFAPHLPAAEMRPRDPAIDDITVVLSGEEHGFIGGIPLASQWEQMADEHRLSESDKEWFVHYGYATTFHEKAGRHVFATADERLLRGRDESPFGNLWRRHRVFSVREVLRLAGAAMRPHGRLYWEAQPHGSKSSIDAYTLRSELASAALPNRVRMYRWLAEMDPTDDVVKQMQRLEQSLHARTMELLRAREGVLAEVFRISQNHATTDEVVYHLRSAVSSIAAACDSLAWLACLALGVNIAELREQRISLRSSDWRSALRNSRGVATADTTAAHGPLLALIKAFRDPIIHQAGVIGMTRQYIGGPEFTEMEITDISDEQIASIEALGKPPDMARKWGLSEDRSWPRLAPLTFMSRLAEEGTSLLDDILEALGRDLKLPLAIDNGPVFMSRHTLRRLRLLSGLDPEGWRERERRGSGA